MQKPPFCTPKTILLHGKNHTFVLRICNIHRMNTLQTLREYPHSPTKTPNEQFATIQHSKNKNHTFVFPKMQCHYTIAQKQHTTAHYI